MGVQGGYGGVGRYTQGGMVGREVYPGYSLPGSLGERVNVSNEPPREPRREG